MDYKKILSFDVATTLKGVSIMDFKTIPLVVLIDLSALPTFYKSILFTDSFVFPAVVATKSLALLICSSLTLFIAWRYKFSTMVLALLRPSHMIIISLFGKCGRIYYCIPIIIF